MEEKKYYTGNVTLNYGEGLPNGYPLLLIHGSGSVWQDWNPVVEYFSDTNHLFAVDLRGFGGSDRTPGSYKFPMFTKDTADFIRGVIPTPPVIVGHSFGALITIDVACRYPDLIKAVVLEDPPLSLHERMEVWKGWDYFAISLEMIRAKISRQEIISRFINELGYSFPEARRSAENLEKIDPEIYEQTLYHNMIHLGENISSALRKIQCPCLFIYSCYDMGSLVKPEDFSMVKTNLKKGTTVQIKDVGHGIHMEAPDDFNKALQNFLSRVE